MRFRLGRFARPSPSPRVQIFDRAAKGIREAPSKALIGELAASCGDSPTAAFGLRQSMALLGASAGASVASLALALTGGNYPLTFALSTVPAVLALLLLSAAFGPGSRGAAAGKRKSDLPARQGSACCGHAAPVLNKRSSPTVGLSCCSPPPPSQPPRAVRQPQRSARPGRCIWAARPEACWARSPPPTGR